MSQNELRKTAPTLHQKSMRLMGNHFEITVVAEDPDWADQRIDEAVHEIRRIEKLLTTFSDTSQTQMINAAAGIQPVPVDQEVFDLISRSIKISSLTQGAFDITYGSIDKKLWNFDPGMTSLPDPATAKREVKLINYRNISLDPVHKTVFLKEKGMRVGFGGIGKGYAAEKAKMMLKKNGVNAGIVNASGDLTVWGLQPNGRPWTIGIASPDLSHHPFSDLQITDMAVATSGNYEKFVLIDGKKYSHTINPKTGLPVHGVKSVTIICPNAEIADAMATPVMIMGVRAGLHLINQIKYMHCLIIDDNDQLFTSKNLHLK